MEDFPSNSHKSKAEPREKIEPVTSGEAIRRKRGLGRQFKDTFFRGTGKDAMSFAIEDVVVPAIRDTLHNAIQGGIERLIYGDSHRAPRPYSGWAGHSASSQSKVDYAGYSQPNKSPAQRILSRGSRARHSFDEIVIPSLQEANEVLDRMYDWMSRYGAISVGELYELTGIAPDHTDMKWGWTHLTGAKAVGNPQRGYVLSLPRPQELV